MSEKRTVVATEFVEKAGETNGKAWTRYGLKDANGDIYSTFTKDVISPVRDLTGQKVDIEFDVNGKFRNLLSAHPHDNGSGVPETYSARTQDDETDWDLIGLRKTRCALWEGFLSGGLAASIYAKASVADGVDAVDTVLRKGKMLIVALEKDVFERAPGDDDVPF